MFDLVISNGNVVTGLGGDALRADIGVRGETIVAIERSLPATGAQRELDARGMLVCPGFIDIHSHSDFDALRRPESDDKIVQGITTEVVGNCGFSLFPFSDEFRDEALDFLGFLFHGIGPADLFAGAAAYFRSLEKTGTNTLSLVGHNMLRISLNGYGQELPSERLSACLKVLDDQVAAGACGLSTGLLYTPSCFADTGELAALARCVKAHDGLFCWHLRDEDEALERSIEEVLAVARQTGVSTQISHLKVSGRGNWGGMAAVLDRIELAVADGLDVTFDSYPYDFGNTCLMTLLPADIVGGDVQEIVEKLQDGHWRERVAGVMNGPRSLVSSIGSENIVISGCVEAKNRELVGKSLRDAAASRGRAITDLIFDLTVEERGRTLIFLSQMCEADVRLALSHRLGCVVTDGIPAPKETAHPRLRSAFLQMLKKYVAEEGVCSLPEAVGKMAALPATKLRLKRRGTLAVGNFADINVFDMDRLKAGSVERRGMEYVVLNGQVVVENGEFSGTLAGKVLRSAHGDD